MASNSCDITIRGSNTALMQQKRSKKVENGKELLRDKLYKQIQQETEADFFSNTFKSKRKN